jgi:hypothetical protein
MFFHPKPRILFSSFLDPTPIAAASSPVTPDPQDAAASLDAAHDERPGGKERT